MSLQMKWLITSDITFDCEELDVSTQLLMLAWLACLKLTSPAGNITFDTQCSMIQNRANIFLKYSMVVSFYMVTLVFFGLAELKHFETAGWSVIYCAVFFMLLAWDLAYLFFSRRVTHILKT